MAKITDKQIDDFAAFLVAGQSQREAYRNTFKQSARWKDKTVDERASRLWKTDKVQTRYRELFLEIKQKNSKMALWSASQAFDEYEWLKEQAKSDIQMEGVRQANSNAFLAAIEGMNTVAGIGSEMQNEKLQAEIELLKSKLPQTEEDESTITGFTFERSKVVDGTDESSGSD